jgi:CheY-like chemotaxis protein
MDLLAAGAAEKQLRLTYLIEEPTPKVIVGDITRLRQILVNLISNAVKFTQRGEVTLSVASADIQDDKLELHFSVADTGIGIPEHKIGLLFRSFSQVDSSTTKHYGGTGLGLAISKRLSEMMGGRMWVESVPDKGSTFHFTIKTDCGPAQQLDYAVASPGSSHGFDRQLGEQMPLRVLMAEDNVVNQRVALRMLEKLGYRADLAANGIEVLEALLRQSYDVVLMDVHMPEMDGLEATREICSRWPKDRRPRIIAMTANAMQGDREECIAAGMDDYISKPVQRTDLKAALERAGQTVAAGPAPAQMTETGLY